MFSRTLCSLQSLINHYERLGLKLAMPKGLTSTSTAGSTTSPEASETSAAVEVFRYCDFTEAHIKAAYRRRALECHPDVAPILEKAKAEADFRRISESFALLSNAEKRKELDDQLQKTFEDKIVKKYGGRVMYRGPTNGAASSSPSDKGPITRAYYGSMERRRAEQARAEEAQRSQTGPFNPKDQQQQQQRDTKEREKGVWVDRRYNIRGTLPAGSGAPEYGHYLKGVEIEEGQPLSSITSTWVRGPERMGTGNTNTYNTNNNNKSSSSSSGTGIGSASSKRRKNAEPFLRKDADKAFREAFDGKSWNEVLFQMRYQGRYGTTINNSNTNSNSNTNNSGDSSSSASSSSSTPPPEGEPAKAEAGGGDNNNKPYTLKSPLLRNAKPLTADETAARILNQRLRALGGEEGGAAVTIGGFGQYSDYRNATPTDGAFPRGVVSGTTALRHSPLYARMATYADSLYARQKQNKGGESSSSSVSFPHATPEAATPIEGISGSDIFNARPKKPLETRQMRVTRITERGRMQRHRDALITSSAKQGKMYSFHRPY